MARGWQGRESSATIVRSIDRKFADRRTDSFTCHGAMCIGAKRPVSSFSPPSVFHLSLPRRSLDFSNLRDAIPPSIRSRLASPRWISSKADISSARSSLLLRITCSSRVKGSYPVYDEGNGSCQTLRIQNWTDVDLFPPLSFSLSPLFFNLRTRFVKLSYESIIRGFKFTRNFESSLLVFLSLARGRRVKQSHSTELHLMLSV